MEPRIVLTPAQEREISEMSSQEMMKAKMREFAENQGLIYRDAYDRDVIHEVANPPEYSAQFTKSVTVNGKTLEFSGATELDAERALGNYLRGQIASHEDGSATTRQEATTVTESAEQAAAKVELELKFKRGEISARDFIEQSGAVDEYLESRGVNIESLQTVSNQHFEQSWAAATKEFLNGPYGSDWPGGDQNREILGMTLQRLGLEDAENKTEALAQAYESMKERGEVQENKELTMRSKLEEATSSDQIREILGRPQHDSIYGGR